MSENLTTLYLGTACPETERMCNSGVCIPSSWFCDGAAECPDSSDELNCEG